jgi:SP family general alpha glucoside:H+ symporter-like MFS transporter
MEGYDTALITSFYAFDEFQKQYGVLDAVGAQYQISPKWQASLSNGSVVGSIIGLFANGVLTERFGYRYTMAGALLLLAVLIFLPFFAFNIQTLLAGQVLCGIPWGVFSMLTTTYAAEVMPLNLRGYLTSNINLCWLLGQLCALGILRGLENVKSTWSFRIPFGLQWVWIVAIFTMTVFAPESPWWLIRRSRKQQAKDVLRRLTRGLSDWDQDNTIAMMEHTERVEDFASRKNASASSGRCSFSDRSYAACFRGSNRRRTEIACMVFMTQNMCGLPIIGYAPYLYKQIGFDQRRSFDITLGMQGLAILGAFASLLLLRYVGRRRTLYLTGLAVCLCLLATAGAVSCLPESRATLWAVVACILTFIFVFDATVGPLTYCLVAELPSNRLRVKTVVLARVAYNINSMVTNIFIQRMLNPLAWNWRGRACFFCAALNALCLVYCYFRLPETRGLSFHELDILFEKGADARKFAAFQAILEGNGYYSLT